MADRRTLPLSPSQVKLIRSQLAEAGDLRAMAMFSLAVDAELGAGHVVSLDVSDVWEKGKLLKRPTLILGKTQKRVSFRMCAYTREALGKWIKQEGKTELDALFTSGRTDRQVGEGVYHRLVEEWLDLAGLDRAVYGPQSLRRTRASMVTRKTRDAKASGKNPTRGKYRPTARDLGGEE